MAVSWCPTYVLVVSRWCLGAATASPLRVLDPINAAKAKAASCKSRMRKEGLEMFSRGIFEEKNEAPRTSKELNKLVRRRQQWHRAVVSPLRLVAP